MGELVELDVTTVEESVTVNVTEEGQVDIAVFAETGPAGPAGPNSVTSATTSDGTCDLSLNTLTVGLSTTSGVRSVAIGQSTASGALSFASGSSTATNDYCFANGDSSTASGYAARASGAGSTATGYAADAAGSGCIASGSGAIAHGTASEATGEYSVAVGYRAKAIHNGASVESDSQDADVESTTTDEKTFRFQNGYRFLGGAVTIDGTLNASHIHGNIAGSVYAHVRAGENLAKGDPVYISGSHGTGANLIAIVSKADASNASKMPAVGVMDAAVSNNANGHMVITGTISDIDTNAYAVNSVLYVASGGGWTSTPPASNSQPVAIVERSNTNNGAVIVKVNGLASSGGNGVSDANKLARYSSAGTLPIASIGGLGTGVSAALAVNTGSAGAFVVNGGALGTPSSGTLTSCTGLPISTGVSGLASGIATFLATPTSANLASAVSDETGSGSLVFASSPTLTSPTLTGTPNFTATNYTFASDARIGFLNNLSSQFVYKNGTIPFAEIFEDFPVTTGTHGFISAGGTVAYYAPSSTNAARYWGALSLTTGATTDNTAIITLAPSGGANGQTTSRFELSHQVCFCVNNATSSEFRARLQGSGQTFDCAVLFGTGVVQLEATNIGGAGVNSVSVATGLTLAAGDFISGTRYRLFVRCISATQTEVYFASAPWNSSTWTTLADTTVTHSSITLANVSSQPVYFVTTKTNAARIAYVDWVAIRYAIQR